MKGKFRLRASEGGEKNWNYKMAMTVVVVAAAASAMAVKGGGDFGLEGCKLQQNLEAQN